MLGETATAQETVQRVKRRFCFVGLLILLVLVVGFAQMRVFVSDHGDMAKIINETGRMRMLMTRTALHAERVANARDRNYQIGLQKTMAGFVERFRQSYAVSVSDKHIMPPEVLSHYTDPSAGLDVQVQAFLKQADRVADHRLHTGLGAHVYDVIAAPNGKLMDSINHAIRLREADWAERLQRAHFMQYGQIGAVLAGLFAMALFCIKPLTGALRGAMDAIDQAEASLEEERNVSSMQRRFVSLVSHEFRTPLAIIDGHANRITRRIETADTTYITDKLTKIRNAVNRLIALTENILSATKMESNELRLDLGSFDLGAEIELIATDISATNPSHEFNLSLGDAPSEITCDPKLMRHLLHILMSNAVKYSPDNPRIDIEARSVKGQVVIKVRDYGIGIPAEELSKVGTRFFRASNAFSTAGTGITLKLVCDILSLHEGKLEIASVEGEGSTFSASFPIRETPAVIAA